MVKKKVKKKAKTRTESKFWNGIISCMRVNFARYSPKYQEVVKRCRVEIKKYNKDGSESKIPGVWNKCEKCGKLSKSLDVDHINGVVPAITPSKYMSLQHIHNRLDCDINNLQGLCKECHDAKTEVEGTQRKSLKKLTKYVIYAIIDFENVSFDLLYTSCKDYDDILSQNPSKCVYVMFASLDENEAIKKFESIKIKKTTKD